MVSTPPPTIVCLPEPSVALVGHPHAREALRDGFRVRVRNSPRASSVRLRARVSPEVAERVGLTKRVVARGPATEIAGCGHAVIRLRFRPRVRQKLRHESPLVVAIWFEEFAFPGP